jgi:hypothetical protein
LAHYCNTRTSGDCHARQIRNEPHIAKDYDNKLYRKFEGANAPIDQVDLTLCAFMREYYFRRRHLAWGWNEIGERDLAYQIESRRLFELMFDGLEFIKQRDGEEIFNEVSRDLLWHALAAIRDIRSFGGLPKSWDDLFKELAAQGLGGRYQDRQGNCGLTPSSSE